MSTSNPTPSVTPAPPSTATYPITALNLFPTIQPASVPANALPYDPDAPQQSWIDPVAAAVIAADPALVSVVKNYSGYISPTLGAPPVYMPFQVPYGEAGKINMPTAAQVAPGGAFATATPIGVTPTPARALLLTETIIPSPMPGGATWYVGNTANGYVPAGSPVGGSASVEAEILDNVEAIEKQFGITPVP